ncbi:MAG: YesL family protein [Oscillibacter sp.]|nr:YesL family protein [Oscillibacter sp.]
MKHFFSMDAPLFRILSTLYDLIILNLLTLAGCLPVVTAGASLTAMHFVLIAMVRDEEPDIVRSWFRSFRENLRQATTIWGVYLLILLLCYWIIRGGTNETPDSLAIGCVGIVLILLFLLSLYLFPFIAHFRNSILRSVGICAALTVAYLFRTAGMAAIYLVSAALFVFFLPIPLAVLFGLSLPGYFCALLYNSVFRRLEGPTDSADGNQETANNL